MKFIAVLVAAGALTACVVKPPVTSPPIEPEIATSDVPAAPAVPEKCAAWLAWLVDGNGLRPMVGVHILTTVVIANECLGRNPTPFEKSPFPLEREAPEPEPDVKPEPKLKPGEVAT